MTAPAVFNTYELAEHIILYIPPLCIYKAAQISKTWRTVATESLAIKEHLGVIQPLAKTDIKSFTQQDIEQMFEQPLLARLQQGDGGHSPSVASFLNQLAEGYAAGKARRPWSTVPFLTPRLRELPHYGSLTDRARISIHPGLAPNVHFETDFHGTQMRMFLPPTAALTEWNCAPAEFVTNPPISAAKVQLYQYERCVRSAWVKDSEGLKLAHLVEVQQRMIEQDAKAGKARRCYRDADCVATIVLDVDVERLRNADPECFAVDSRATCKRRSSI